MHWASVGGGCLVLRPGLNTSYSRRKVFEKADFFKLMQRVTYPTPLGCMPLRERLTAVHRRTLSTCVRFLICIAQFLGVDFAGPTAAEDMSRFHGLTTAIWTLHYARNLHSVHKVIFTNIITLRVHISCFHFWIGLLLEELDNKLKIRRRPCWW